MSHTLLYTFLLYEGNLFHTTFSILRHFTNTDPHNIPHTVLHIVQHTVPDTVTHTLQHTARDTIIHTVQQVVPHILIHTVQYPVPDTAIHMVQHMCQRQSQTWYNTMSHIQSYTIQQPGPDTVIHTVLQTGPDLVYSHTFSQTLSHTLWKTHTTHSPVVCPTLPCRKPVYSQSWALIRPDRLVLPLHCVHVSLQYLPLGEPAECCLPVITTLPIFLSFSR